jgi:acetolactate synthase-1/2/3 large subunit
MKSINIWKNKYNFKITNELTIPLIISKLSEKFNEQNINPIISTGVGVHQMQLAQYYKFKYPNRLLTSGSQGTMGVGLPFAIGAKIAEPNSFVLCIDGDGSFQMTSSDLMTIVQYNLPIKIIIMDNQELQMVTYWQEKFYNSHFSSSKFKNPDFVKFANSFGIEGIQCDNIIMLDYVINKIINHSGPMLIHMIVNKTDCLPFVPPSKGLNEMILE